MKSSHTRVDRLSDLIRREVSEIILRQVKDPRINLVTVTYAEVAKDLRSAKIFISTLREGKDLAETLRGLEKAAGFIQKKLAERVHLRYIPKLVFLFDPSLEQGARMQQIFRNLSSPEWPEESK